MSQRPLRFLASGCTAAFTEYFIFLSMQVALDDSAILISQATSFSAGLIVSFLLNRYWVFRSEGTWRTEALKYGVLAAGNLLLTSALLLILTSFFNTPAPLAKIGVMMAAALWNYAIFSRLVFK